MAVELKIHDKEFIRYLRRATATGLRRAGVYYHTACRRAVNISNRRGMTPSLPGQPPHKGTGLGQSNIVFEHDAGIPASRVGVRKNAMYLIGLELGTKPHVIRPRYAKLLRIPYLGSGRPSEDEIQRRGWRQGPADGRGHRWFRFAKQVKHPGTRPRPWLVATLLRFKDIIGRLACSGGDTK